VKTNILMSKQAGA